MDITSKLANRLSQKLATKEPYRSDFVLADFRSVTGNAAEVLFQFDRQFGAPSRETVAQTIAHLYKAQDGRPRLQVDLASIKFFPRQDAVACVVARPKIRRPMGDARSMQTIVAGTMFLGENMSDTWAVAKSEDGSVFIERVEDDNVEEILRERSRAKSFRTHAGVNLTLNAVHASTAEASYELGDWVTCSSSGKLLSAQILGMSEGVAHVRFKNGQQSTVSLASIHGLVSASAESLAKNREAIKEYYRKAYGYDEKDLEKLVTFID